MRLGTAIVLLALGAILTFALRVDLSGVDLQVVGWILMIVGALGIVLEVAVWGPRSRRRVTHTEGYGAPPEDRSSGPPPTRPTDPVRREPPSERTGALARSGSGPDDGRLAAKCTTRLQAPDRGRGGSP